MSEDDRPAPLQQLDERLRQVREREAREAGPQRPTSGGPTQPSGLGIALRVGSELVAGVVVGAGLGWALDRWLGTGPFLMVVCFLLGSAAGMLNVWRSLQRMGRTDGQGGK